MFVIVWLFLFVCSSLLFAGLFRYVCFFVRLFEFVCFSLFALVCLFLLACFSLTVLVCLF